MQPKKEASDLRDTEKPHLIPSRKLMLYPTAMDSLVPTNPLRLHFTRFIKQRDCLSPISGR
jgi:hypothetical protein